MFTICIGKEEIDSQKNSISGITEKIGLEKRLSDDFDKVITGEMQGNKEDFIGVIDFEVLECFRQEQKIIICGKNFRRMFFPKYTIFLGKSGTFICKKGICVTIAALFFAVFFARFFSLLFEIRDFRLSIPVYVLLLAVLFVFFYNLRKGKEEKEEIEMLLAKIIN